MDQVEVVSCYVFRQKKRRRLALVVGEPEEYEYEYEVWIVDQVLHRPLGIGGHGNRQDLAEFLLAQLRESVADVLADRVEGTVWKSAALPRQQALALVADLPDDLRQRAAMPLTCPMLRPGSPWPEAIPVRDGTPHDRTRPLAGRALVRPARSVAG